MTSKTLQELRDELRDAEGYAGDCVGESNFNYYHQRVVAIRKELYAHPEAVAMAERFAREREERMSAARAFYADPRNKGKIFV